MASPNERESKLLDLSKKYDAAVADRDAKTIESLLADDVTLHKDGISLGDDVKGKQSVLDWNKAYFEKYDYKHESVVGAVNDEDNVIFSFWTDEGVKPKEGGPDSTTVGIWHHALSGDKISDIYLLRQLSRDEEERKLKKPLGQKLPFDPKSFAGSAIGQSEERRPKFTEAAKKYNEIWRSGNPDLADEVLVEDFKMYNPVLGNTTSSRKEFKDMISQYSKHWTVDSQDTKIAVSAGDKGFLWWLSHGTEQPSGKKDSLYGLNMLVFTEDAKIKQVIGFRELTQGEQQEYIKEEYRR